jgi:hypothetical protein
VSVLVPVSCRSKDRVAWNNEFLTHRPYRLAIAGFVTHTASLFVNFPPGHTGGILLTLLRRKGSSTVSDTSTVPVDIVERVRRFLKFELTCRYVEAAATFGVTTWPTDRAILPSAYARGNFEPVPRDRKDWYD